MAALAEQMITVYRGEAIVQPFAMTPSENIAAWTLVFTVAKAVNKSTKLIGPVAVTITNGPTGLFQVVLLEEQTNVKPGTYRWDVWRTDEGLEQPKATGPFVVLGNARVPPIEVVP